MAKQYIYTLLRQDGSKEIIGPCEKKHFQGDGGLYEILNCRTIELIHRDYYQGQPWAKGHLTVYGDEEARFNPMHITNPHFNVLTDLEGEKWDVVGDLVVEQVYHGK